MKFAYTMLTDGNCGDWGQCMLVDQELGEVIKGEKNINELPAELLCFLIRGHNPISDEDLDGFSDEEFEKLEEDIYDKNSYDSYIYNYLSNALYEQKNPYIIEFGDIAQMANYVRLKDIQIIENLL